MIEINLLPETVRPQKKAYFKLDIGLTKVKLFAGASIAGVLILLLIILSVGSSVRKGQILKLMAKEEITLPQKLDIEAVNREIVLLQSKLDAFDGITKRSFLWAQKLNELSGMVLQGIWFTRIQTDVENRLIIEGSVISKKEEAMVSVGKFMKKIMENSSFFKDFSNINLETLERSNIENRGVVDFRILLYF